MKPNVLTGPIATRAVKPCNLHSCTKEDILENFENAFSLDEWLFTSLKDESVFSKTPDRLRLPLIFYYCHPAVVFVNKMLLSGLINERVDETFEALFETGVDEMSWDDTENYRMGGTFQWPRVEEARQYRSKIRELVRNVINRTPLTLPIDMNSKWWSILMGIEHERIHLETSSVLIRQLPVEMVEIPSGWKYGPLEWSQPVMENPFVLTDPTTVVIGKDSESPLWGWDNEYGKRIVDVPRFEASKYLLTNREYLKFVLDGGYESKKYWNEEGWKWRSYRQAKHPTFWVCDQGCKSGGGLNLAGYSHCNVPVNGSEFRFRLMFDVVGLPLDWPVEVNYLEAKAYCKWRGDGVRLATEAEHHVMRGIQPFDSSVEAQSEKEVVNGSNVDLDYGSSTPVDMFPPSSTGFCDVSGNVWEWIEDDNNGLPGFETHYLYDDFSSPCFGGKHTMILGGSWISSGDEATRYARYAFRRHFFQHLGFRAVRTNDPANPSPVFYVDSTVYVCGIGEEERGDGPDIAASIGLKPIMERSMHIGIVNDTDDTTKDLAAKEYESSYYDKLIPIFKTIASSVISNATEPSRALVVGCGTGCLAFEFSKLFDEVIACDTSGRSIDFAEELKENGKAYVPNLGFKENGQKNGRDNCHNGKNAIRIPNDVIPSRVVFMKLNWLPVELGTFDLVIVDGLERVQNQKAWLIRIRSLLKDKSSVAVIIHPDDITAKILKVMMESHLKADNEFADTSQPEAKFRKNSFVRQEKMSVWRLGHDVLTK